MWDDATPDDWYQTEVAAIVGEIRTSREAGHGDRYPRGPWHESGECTICDAFRILDTQDES